MQNSFSVHRLYLQGQQKSLAKPFPYLEREGFTMRAIGKGDGNSTLLYTQERFVSEKLMRGIWVPNIHPFEEGADEKLENLVLMDHIALGQLLCDVRQTYLKLLHHLYGLNRVEVRYDFAESEEWIQTFGAERSGVTEKWFSKNYIYQRGYDAQYVPAILTLLPPEETQEE